MTSEELAAKAVELESLGQYLRSIGHVFSANEAARLADDLRHIAKEIPAGYDFWAFDPVAATSPKESL